MDISIVGAGGAVGRQIAVGLIRAGLIPSNSRLQLVGHRGGESQQSLPGIATDLADAFAEDLPELDLAFEPKDVVGDIIVLAAGDPVRRGDTRSRADLASCNQPVVESYARAIARTGHGEELLLVLTNPVEASVGWCCRYLDRRRVIGMGAYLDTLRFRQEIAHDLGVRRQRVQGLVLGEHGPRMVPCWSTVDVHGFDSPDGRARLAALQRPKDPSVADAVRSVMAVASARGSAAAYAYTERFGPALRTIVKPYITQLCGARSPASTAEMIVRLLGTLLSGGQVLTAAQVKLEGEFLDLHGVVGAPIVMTLGGIDRVVQYELSSKERTLVQAALYDAPRPHSRGAQLHAPSGAPEAPTSGPKARRRVQDQRATTEAWECTLVTRAGTRPGNVERVGAVFAGRGISLHTFHAEAGSSAKLTLRFSASARVKAYLARRLARIRDIRSVRIVRTRS